MSSMLKHRYRPEYNQFPPVSGVSEWLSTEAQREARPMLARIMHQG